MAVAQVGSVETASGAALPLESCGWMRRRREGRDGA